MEKYKTINDLMFIKCAKISWEFLCIFALCINYARGEE